MNGADDMGIGAGLDVSLFGFLEPAMVGFCGDGFSLGNVAMEGLLFLNDFLLFEVPKFCTLFSLFIFFSNSCLKTSSLLSFVSFLFCFASISLSVCLLRVSSTPFFLTSVRFFRRFSRSLFARLWFLFWLIPWYWFGKFFHRILLPLFGIIFIIFFKDRCKGSAS
ncbi:hypothetical protein Hanom_Chr16g01466751 [Helianthus anomalus]